jgi:hypothetical protein
MVYCGMNERVTVSVHVLLQTSNLQLGTGSELTAWAVLIAADLHHFFRQSPRQKFSQW